MALNKLLLIGGTTLAVGLASVVGAGVVSAQGGAAASGSNSIVDKMAQKFNLKSSDVQKVFDEDRATHEAEHQATVKTTLDQAVKDSKISADQEAKLLAKLDEMHANRPDIKNMTQAERDTVRSALDAKRTEFEAWLKANNIPTDLVPQPGMGNGPRGGERGQMMHATSETTKN